ncbi:MAG: 50S ribosomal protein L9 [Gammaproteobacteria bacterium]|nr:50S ribosomal protein L9 [Gammaproteobacteria bacterium]
MEIILLEKIQNVGEMGDLVDVRNGYARNYLIPRKKAMIATAEAKKEVEEKRRQLAEAEGNRLLALTARAESAARDLTLIRLCGEKGQLYGSVSPADIAEALTQAGTPIEKSEVFQPDGPIKQVGQYEAEVILHPDIRFTVNVQVQGDSTPGPVVDEIPPETSEEVPGDTGVDDSGAPDTA